MRCAWRARMRACGVSVGAKILRRVHVAWVSAVRTTTRILTYVVCGACCVRRGRGTCVPCTALSERSEAQAGARERDQERT